MVFLLSLLVGIHMKNHYLCLDFMAGFVIGFDQDYSFNL